MKEELTDGNLGKETEKTWHTEINKRKQKVESPSGNFGKENEEES